MLRRFMCVLLSVSLIFTALTVLAEPEPAMDVKGSLEHLGIEEKSILEELFILVQKVKEMEEVQKNTSKEIEIIKADIELKEIEINEQALKYDSNLNIMEDILKNHQKRGSISYLELIVSSDSLSTLLRRINVLRDISRNTENLLINLEKSKDLLIQHRDSLNQSLVSLEEMQRDMQHAINKENELIDQLENRLEALQEDKSKYEAYLQDIETNWKEIRPIFSETIGIIVETIEEGNLPLGTVELSLTTSGIKGVIREDKLRRILEAENFPTSIALEFSEGKLQLKMPDIDVYINGNLIIHDPQTLIFDMTDGRYLGMKLEKSAMEELFSMGHLQFNFKKLLEKNTIKAIKIKEDSLELTINPVLF